jgi:hypothetical protein
VFSHAALHFQKNIHADDHRCAVPPFLKAPTPLFFGARNKVTKKIPLHTPTLGAWFHPGHPASDPLMLYDPPESGRWSHEKLFCEISEPGPSWTARPATPWRITSKTAFSAYRGAIFPIRRRLTHLMQEQTSPSHLDPLILLTADDLAITMRSAWESSCRPRFVIPT